MAIKPNKNLFIPMKDCKSISDLLYRKEVIRSTLFCYWDIANFADSKDKKAEAIIEHANLSPANSWDSRNIYPAFLWDELKQIAQRLGIRISICEIYDTNDSDGFILKEFDVTVMDLKYGNLLSSYFSKYEEYKAKEYAIESFIKVLSKWKS